jgi:hypothetical protein
MRDGTQTYLIRSMSKIKLLQVQFSDTIAPWELPAFRGAVVAKVGRAHHWFHNHLHDKQYLYRYPKIQYKCIKGRPVLLCIHEGVEEIHKLFDQADWSLRLHDRALAMRIDRLDMRELELKTMPQPQEYRIYRWMGLNQENYSQYQGLRYQTDQLLFLEQKLVSNIISFAKSVQWHIDARFEVKITQLRRQHWVKYKNQRFAAFDLNFETEVFLPKNIGLGRKVSVGFGTVMPVKT